MTKKCKSCKQPMKFTERNGIKTYDQRYGYGIGCGCYFDWLKGGSPRAQKVIESSIIKGKKHLERQSKIKKKEQKEKLKTLGQLEKEAKKVFQKYIRLRDVDLPCISCGAKETDLWDGGHFYKAEIYSGLIFDERNCHKQCRKCNRFLGGNENNYRLGLIERFGMPYVLQLDADAVRLRNYKYSRLQLIEIKNEYKQKIKELWTKICKMK